MKIASWIAGIVLLAAGGCMSYDYEGESAGTPTEEEHVKVFTDSARITQNYQVLGVATVSGNYQDVSREKMIDKLKSEAAKNGADAVLIVNQQVIPGKAAQTPVFQTQFDYDSAQGSWNQVSQDVDLYYGSAFDRTKSVNTEISTYSRIIRAQFIRYQK